MSDSEGNVGVAFGMVCGAGACTSLGAGMAFCVNLESKRFLAVSLALSCGVMFYVSMVEIFVKALMALSDEYCPLREVGEPCARAYGATTGFFFLGLAITSVLNMITSAKSLSFLCGKLGFKCFAPLPESGVSHQLNSGVHGEGAEGCCDAGTGAASEPSPLQLEAQPLPPGWEVKVTIGSMKPFFYHPGSKEYSWDFPGLQGASHCPCHNGEIEMSSTDIKTSAQDCGLGVTNTAGTDGVLVQLQGSNVNSDLERNHPEVDEQARLNATGLLTGLAIAIHNFPEGLATFVAAMADPSLGAAIAVAIAIHNVPEGVCVAMPIYYATGSRTRAFLWATLSGVSEPIGALFGWAVLGGDVSNMAYGSMFGIVAGMMVYISLGELLPSAYRYEKNPAVVTGSMVSGMVIMALSLLAFQI